MSGRRARWLTVAAVALAVAGVADFATAACPQATDAVKGARAANDAAAGARDALILARRAAQDWKNLLLRGSDALERSRIQARFDAQAQGYEKQLLLLGAQLQRAGVGRDLLARLEEERKRMFAAYRRALETRGVNDLASAAQADRDVQGVDVPTFRTLEEMIATLDKLAGEQFERAYTAIGHCGGS